MSTSSGRYAVPPEILKHKPRGSMVKKIHGGYYVYAMENVKNPVTGKWQTKTKEILGKRLFWYICGSHKPSFPYATLEKPDLRAHRFGSGIFRSEQYNITM